MSEERKLVTVLFADIVGSTATGFEHDPEVVRDALARTFDAARAVLETHGGTVEKFIGDAVMAVFGVPNAHDDDADRAVRAAFALRERIAEVAPAKLAFVLRIGVNTGEAVTGTGQAGQFLVTGPVVNVAARVQQAAAPGEILVGPLTHRLTRDGIEYGAPRDIDAKGAGRLAVHPAASLTTDVPSQHRGIPGLRAALIGRDRELELLRGALERAQAERAPALVTIFGAPGAGKSRLTSEFLATLPADRVRVGRCLPYGEGITFYPVQLLLRADADVGLGADRADAEAKLERAVATAFADAPDDRDAVHQRLRVVLGFATPNEALPEVAAASLAEEIRWGVRRYFERRAGGSPLVLVFEDVHWAEPALLDIVEHVAESARAPLLVVCLARHEFRELRPTFGANVPNTAAITLAPLGPEDTRRLIGELLAIDALPERLRTDVIARAEGNPLYVEEFLRMLIDTDRVVRSDGRWVGTGDLADIEVPPSLMGLITARLDRMPAPVKRVLQRASIVGRLFSTAALEAIGGEPAEAEVLREAVRRDLLVEADERAPGQGRVHRFKHALIREVAYSTVPKSDRARMHGNYARWLEATLGERREEVAEILAYHHEQAFLYASELGRDEAGELGAHAFGLLVNAADRARRRFDLHAALNLYERASAIAGAIPVGAAREVHVRGYALIARYIAVTSAAEGTELAPMVALAEATGPSEVLVDLLIEQGGWAYSVLGDSALSRRAHERAVKIAHALGDAEKEVDALASASLDAYSRRDLPAERRLLEEAVAVARQRAPHALPRILTRLALNLALRDGAISEATALLAEAAALRPRELSSWLRARLARADCHFAFVVGDIDEAVARGQEALARAREAATPWDIAMSLWYAGSALFEAGDASSGRALLEEGAATVDRVGAKGQIPELHARVARACLRLGDIDAAREHVRVSKVNLLDDDVDSYFITAVAEAELADATADVAGAETIFKEALERLEREGFLFDLTYTRLAYADVLIRHGRFADSKRLLLAAREFFHDPLAHRWRERVDALIAKCEAGMKTATARPA